MADIGLDEAVSQISALADGPVALALFAAGLPVTGSADLVKPAALADAAGFKAAGVTRFLHALRDRFIPGSPVHGDRRVARLEPGPRDAAPGTANAALVNLMRQVSQLLGPRGVVVRTIAPGPLERSSPPCHRRGASSRERTACRRGSRPISRPDRPGIRADSRRSSVADRDPACPPRRQSCTEACCRRRRRPARCLLNGHLNMEVRCRSLISTSPPAPRISSGGCLRKAVSGTRPS